MTETTKTTKAAKAAKTKAVVPTAPAIDETAAQAGNQPLQQFSSVDELEHFIHHNPQFGTLDLAQQNELRAQFVQAKREQALKGSEHGHIPG